VLVGLSARASGCIQILFKIIISVSIKMKHVSIGHNHGEYCMSVNLIVRIYQFSRVTKKKAKIYALPNYSISFMLVLLV
jgi:glucan phosphorylase